MPKKSFVYICGMELYIVDGLNKKLRHRVALSDVIMCQSTPGGCVITINNRANIIFKNTIDSVYDFYFKKAPGFIRSHASYIVNTGHIISAEERPYYSDLTLLMAGGSCALLRRSHDYAYYILTGEKKRKKLEVMDSEEKDAIIMSDIKTVKDIVAEIKRATGEDVTARYVVKRYKQLKIQL